jgi:hypothetical protein
MSDILKELTIQMLERERDSLTVQIHFACWKYEFLVARYYSYWLDTEIFTTNSEPASVAKQICYHVLKIARKIRNKKRKVFERIPCPNFLTGK